MIDGVENLKYSDVEVKINIDETTGKIDEILMDFQASMQYQGYNADMQYTVKYKFLRKRNSRKMRRGKIHRKMA